MTDALTAMKKKIKDLSAHDDDTVLRQKMVYVMHVAVVEALQRFKPLSAEFVTQLAERYNVLAEIVCEELRR